MTFDNRYTFVVKYPRGHSLYLDTHLNDRPVLVDDSFEVFPLDIRSPILVDDDQSRGGPRFWVKGTQPTRKSGADVSWTVVPFTCAADLAVRYGMALADYAIPSRGWSLTPWTQ